MLPKFKQLWCRPLTLFALGFGSGLSPKAPGTVGTLAAIPFYLVLALLPLNLQIMLILLALIFGVYCCGYVAKSLGVHDHPGIVWDEFVGYWVCMLVLPIAGVPLSWQWVLLGFGLFRFFDIVKPWPIQWVDRRVSGGLGIMFDDVLAGIFAGIVLYVIIQW